MTLKRLATLFSLLMLALFLNIGQSGAAPPQQGGITFSGSEFLGNPTDTSITINVVPDSNINIFYEYGTSSGVYTGQTATTAATAGEPHEVVITGLQPDTEYYYRMQYQIPPSGNLIARPEHSFHTARPAGSTYQFVITSDSHVNILLGVLSQWQTALDLIDADNPDFLIDLGDTFNMDGVNNAATADANYLFQRDPDILGRASGSVPMFFAMGNHENEEGWNFDDTNPQPIFGLRARKRYFPLPSPLTAPSFYTTNADPVEADDVSGGNSYIIGDDQYREDYYAWEWGDALFVVFDPFEYTMQNPYGASAGEGNDEVVGGDRWNWTLGVEQHQWLNDVLANSNAKYKFMFAHHMLGGTQNYVRGGAEAAHQFEWGGYNADGTTYGFDAQRPAAQGWIDPVRQMMIDYGVTAFFHGHDHQYVYEVRDGIVYQLVPAASQNTSNGFNSYISSPYAQQILPNSGYLRVTIAPNEALVEYVKSTGNNVGQVEFSYTMEPNDVTEPDHFVTATAGPNGTITPSGSVGVVAGANQSFTITPSSGYQIADVEVDNVSQGPISTYTFTNIQADHSIAATFVEAPPSSEVIVDGLASSNTAAANSSSISFAHTTGTGADRLTLVAVSWNNGSSEQEITSVTFTPTGGSAQNLNEVFNEQATTQPRNAAIYSLLNPASGQSGTVTVNFSGGVSNGIVAGAVNFAGVNQADPFGTPAGASNGSGSAPTVTLTGLGGDELIFDTVFQGAADVSQTLTAGSGQIQQWNDWISNTRAAASVEQATGSSVTMSWTAASSAVWVIAAVPINPAPLTGTTYELTIGTDGNGTTTPTAGTYTYAENTVVNISTSPNTNYEFDSWTGDVANPNSASTTVMMDGDKAVTANFTEIANSAPVANDDSVTTDEDTPVNITLTASDANNDPLTYAVVNEPTNGTLSGTPPNLTYTPNSNFNGSDSFTFTANDGEFDSNTATVDITVNAINDAPIAENDSFTVQEDGNTTLPVLSNDDDIEGDTLNVASVTDPANGNATNNGTNVSYAPDADYCGPDSFSYTVSDGITNGNTATVDITVECANDAPVANDDNVTTGEDTPVNITLTADDADDDPLSYAVVDEPTNGALSGTPPNLTYTPNSGYTGPDSFTFQANDGTVNSNIATINIAITSEPVALIEFGTVTVGGNPVTVNLDNTYVSPVVVASAQYNNNSIPIVVRVSNVGPTSFDVRLQNPSDSTIAAETVSYLVVEEGVWTIDGVNFEAQTYLSTVTDSDSSWVGQAQSYGQSYSNPVVLGQVMSENDADWSVFWSQGSSRANPPSSTVLTTGKMVGEDSDTTRSNETIGFIVFEAGHGTINGVEFEAFVGPNTIQGVGNSPPYAYSFDTNFATAPDTAVTTMAGVDGPNGGWAQTHGSTLATATSLFLSIDEDQVGDSERNHIAEEVAYIAFGGIANTPPLAVNDSVTTDEDTPVTIDVLDNDSDDDGDTLTIAAVTQPTNGNVTNNTIDVTYTPAADYCGSDSFGYTANDGNNGSDTATVNITVTCTNDAPVADDQNVSTEQDTPVNITLTGSDIDGDGLTYAVVDGPTNGVLSGSGANQTYTPTPSFIGTDSFTFQANDGTTDSNLATVTIQVTAGNVPPTADAGADQIRTLAVGQTTINVTLDGSTSSDPDGTVTTYTWTGTPDPDDVAAPEVTLGVGVHVFTLVVTDDDGAGSDPDTVTITVNEATNQAPVADAGPDQNLTLADGQTTINVTLDGSVSSDLDGTVTTYTWTGSPDPADVVAPEVTLGTGTHVFTLVVTDDDGADSDPDTVTITVNEAANQAPVADAGPDQIHTLANGQTTINVTLDGAASFDPDGTVTTFTWTGSPNPDDVVSPEVTLGAGTYVFTLVVTDDDGTDSDPDTVTIIVNEDTSTPPSHIYVSSDRNGAAPSFSFADEDILAFNLNTEEWSLYFDGSDVGLSGVDLTAFSYLEDGSILMSFDTSQFINGLGTVDDSDIIRFIPTSLGSQTTGSGELYFDGSDVGLTSDDEDIDAIGLTQTGALVISTVGDFGVTGVSGSDEDLIIFTPTGLGQNTSGTWEPYFDGSDVDLTLNSEDVNGAWIDNNSDIYLTTEGNYAVPGITDGGADIFICQPSSLGTNTNCTFNLFWRGTDHGIGNHVLDAFTLGNAPAVQPTLVSASLIGPDEKVNTAIFLPLIRK